MDRRTSFHETKCMMTACIHHVRNTDTVGGSIDVVSANDIGLENVIKTVVGPNHSCEMNDAVCLPGDSSQLIEIGNVTSLE